MAGAQSIYCCDTSSLIHAWRRAYPPKSFKSFYSRDSRANEREHASCFNCGAEVDAEKCGVMFTAATAEEAKQRLRRALNR